MDRSTAPQRRGLRLRGVRRLAAIVLGMSLALLAGCAGPPPPQPTMDEVLDGPATAQARTAGFELLDQRVAGFPVPGVSEIARQKYLTCWEGHNNWKTHDGFRLKCETREMVYLGWDGAFYSGVRPVLANMKSLCTDPGGYDKTVDVTPGGPNGPAVVGGPGFRCTGGVGVDTELFRSSEIIEPILSGWDEMRWVSGPRGAALGKRLKAHRWILAARVRATFYQDEP